MFGVSHMIHGTGIFTNDATETRIGSHANATCAAVWWRSTEVCEYHTWEEDLQDSNRRTKVNFDFQELSPKREIFVGIFRTLLDSIRRSGESFLS